VVVDSLRADHVGCYGYQRETTPFLDRVAREGVLFEDVTAQGTYTLPSVASMLTSSYPLAMGSVFAPDGPPLPPGREMIMHLPPVTMPVSLQGELRKLGYHTLGWVGGGFLDPLFGFAQGFDYYHAPEREQTIPLAAQLPHIQERLAAASREPFFLFLHTHDVHNYFQGGRHGLERFDRGYAGRLSDREQLSRTVLSGSAAGLSADDLRYLVDLYDGGIKQTDRLLGSFVDWLFARQWGANTLLAITSDHGEAFGERGVLHHGHGPHPWLVRVPLLIRFPDGRWPRRRVLDPVSLADLMPTLLASLGAGVPAGLAGRSLLPLMSGERDAEPRAALCECSGPILLTRLGRWWHYLLLAEHTEILFDLQADPELETHVTAAEPARLRHMQAALAALSVYASRGYRLVVSGARPKPLQVQLRVSTGFTYFLAPTVWRPGALRVSRSSAGGPIEAADLTLPPGDEPHVVLFEPAKPGAVVVSATMGRRAVGASRYHLGASGASPRRVPLAFSAPPTPAEMMSHDPPVPAAPATWGIWVWLPSALAAGQAVGEPVGPLPRGVEDQLRALGYID